jgi:hypothetical protein
MEENQELKTGGSIVLRWTATPSRNFIDVLPKGWLLNPPTGPQRINYYGPGFHSVHPAICEVHRDSSYAYIDYGGNNASENERNGCVPGTYRFLFREHEGEAEIQEIFWRPNAQSPYEKAPVILLAHEGEPYLVAHTARERRPELRRLKLATAERPIRCEACRLDFDAWYGPDSAVAICEVHHEVPLKYGPVDTEVQTLRILCPTCHTKIHRTNPMLLVKDLAAMMKNRHSH